jgi:excisionase family DNA binding protein
MKDKSSSFKIDEKNAKVLSLTHSKATNVNSIFDNQIGENLLTKKMLAEKLCYSVSNINKLMRQNKIPFLKNGKSVRFLYSEVLAALKKESTA